MARISPAEAGGVNVLAFLDMLAYSEGTPQVAGSDDGYNVLVGGKLFTGYGDHPRILVALLNKQGQPILDQKGQPLKSTAAGRYQEKSKNYDYYRQQLGLSNFGPVNQDRMAIQQIKERRALVLIQQGKISDAIAACCNIWASLPGAGYGQRENPLSALLASYTRALGALG